MQLWLANLKIKKQDKEEKKEISNKIKQQTTLIYKGPEGSIISPQTKAASCFWGKGTKWCTAASDPGVDNEFAIYYEDGDLYVVLLPNGTKYQVHLETGSLTDAANDDVDVQTFNKQHPWVIEKILAHKN
ncbi:MAG: hypothetical protein HC817_15830 [Saprospiraceae bacterium]|nr:hypothetical protein [Saprospiraceae bacterium]